jgi:hypothetical protein
MRFLKTTEISGPSQNLKIMRLGPKNLVFKVFLLFIY